MTARQKIAYAIGAIGVVLMLPGRAVFGLSCWIARERGAHP
jgi:hypothetical protein